jgi:hypothetical protein
MTVTTCSWLTVYLRVLQVLVALALAVFGLLGEEATLEVRMLVEVTATDPAPSKIQTSSPVSVATMLTSGMLGWSLSLNPLGAVRHEPVLVALYSPKRSASPITASAGDAAKRPRDRAALASPIVAQRFIGRSPDELAVPLSIAAHFYATWDIFDVERFEDYSGHGVGGMAVHFAQQVLLTATATTTNRQPEILNAGENYPIVPTNGRNLGPC